ncbi:hypothetical protein APICC_03793 [Apis cerana cerana]|uniref:Uncharacterized protein n=1 Tax=Apis cerana cerana TaxID=94128 RepID=A0A2A3E926_APICC|nr:hypothetical protein APICC_03793 [Apis cerana cerana]
MGLRWELHLANQNVFNPVSESRRRPLLLHSGNIVRVEKCKKEVERSLIYTEPEYKLCVGERERSSDGICWIVYLRSDYLENWRMEFDPENFLKNFRA